MDAHSKNIYIAVLITVIVLGFIIFYFAISLIRHQRKIISLTRKNILIEITGLEKERSRIASDLHDEVGPILSAIKMKINSFELPDEEDRMQVIKTNNHIDTLLKRLREISFDLMPTSLLRKGLSNALRELVTTINKHSAIKVIYTDNCSVTLAEEKIINVYRIIQEVIHNSLKHSKATEIKIDLSQDKKNIFLKISDNGIGFNYTAELKDNIGFGLKNLQSRSQLAGGKMYSDTSINPGTGYLFEIPI